MSANQRSGTSAEGEMAHVAAVH